MFDISWSELLILGVVTLVFVGPKELPVFLRTLGRYFGMMQRQAAEFRAQFDEAMREAELDQMKKDVEAMSRDVEARVREADRTIHNEVAGVRHELDKAAASAAPLPRAGATPDTESAAALPATEAAPSGQTPEPVPDPALPAPSEKAGG